MKKSIITFAFIATLLVSACYKKNTPEGTNKVVDENKEKVFYSLKINTNIKEVTNYAVNVDDVNKIEQGTNVTITNTPGYYKIIQFMTTDGEVLSTNNTYTFKMESNVEINLVFIYSISYFASTQVINNSKHANIILMSGQSNMEGHDAQYSVLNSSIIDEYSKGHTNVKINYNCCEGKNYTFGIESCGAFTSVKFGQGKTNKELGPEIGLSKFLGDNSKDEEYYLIKVAHGGTNIAVEWNPDNIDKTYQFPEGSRYMYKKFITSIDACIDNFTKNNVDFSIKAMCWFQGEYDSKVKSYADNYDKNFKYLQSSIKYRYGKYYSDDFKWISAGISTTTNVWTYSSTVNEALKNNSDRFIEETKTMERINSAHYTAQSYLTIGEYFGRELLN